LPGIFVSEGVVALNWSPLVALSRGAALMLVVAIAGCASAPAPKPVAAPTKLFFPPAPDAPRIQHLASFSGERDLAAERSALAKFVAGEQSGRELEQIYGVALSEGRLYAVDSKGAAVAIFDLNKPQFSMFNGGGGGRMKRPINLKIDSDGTKYITDTGRDQVLVFDRENNFVAAYGEKGQFRPVDVAIAGDRLYVVDILHHQVQVLDKRTGRLLSTFGKPGSKEGELFHPTNIAIGPDGDLYIAETSNFRVQRFKPDGKTVRSYGEVGDTPGKFARPKGVALDRAGRLYVSDAAFQNVQIFAVDGSLLMAFGQSAGPETLSLPAAIAIDYDNVALFRKYADPKFTIEFLILVASQISPNKVDVYGFGRLAGADYSADDKPATAAKP
jgi:DNA-binding beta-propeller fold protein YncE